MFNERISRAILDGRFEETELGLLVPSERSIIQGVFRYCKRGEPEEMSTNLVVTQGLNYLVGVALKATTAITAWYIAPFSGDVTVQATWTAANFTANATEFTAYASATRPAWTGGSVTSGAVDSFAAKAEIKSTANGSVVRGAAMISVNTKSATTGTLLGASRFVSSKTIDLDEIIDVGYGLSITAAP
jgi:hypothetical protein